MKLVVQIYCGFFSAYMSTIIFPYLYSSPPHGSHVPSIQWQGGPNGPLSTGTASSCKCSTFDTKKQRALAHSPKATHFLHLRIAESLKYYDPWLNSISHSCSIRHGHISHLRPSGVASRPGLGPPGMQSHCLAGNMRSAAISRERNARSRSAKTSARVNEEKSLRHHCQFI